MPCKYFNLTIQHKYVLYSTRRTGFSECVHYTLYVYTCATSDAEHKLRYGWLCESMSSICTARWIVMSEVTEYNSLNAHGVTH